MAGMNDQGASRPVSNDLLEKEVWHIAQQIR